ncbi:competence type IV pilus minor pilin ComGF [Enterococcus sp. LJL120]
MAKKLKFFENFNSKGFTLLECLIALLIISGICWLFSLLVGVSQGVSQQFPTNHQQEFYTFLFQLEQEAAPLQTLTVSNHQLSFSDPLPGKYDKDPSFTISYRNERIDKTKKNQGTQPLLTSVKQLTMTVLEGEIEFKVLFQDGKESQGSYVLKKYQQVS